MEMKIFLAFCRDFSSIRAIEWKMHTRPMINVPVLAQLALRAMLRGWFQYKISDILWISHQYAHAL
jgi:hypothetical protein